MYGLVPYNISKIQMGIQYGHALQEYNNILGETYDEFNTWRLEDKTFIILNGGTSMTMEQHVETLKDADIHVGVFQEPDLNNMTTGIVFLVPEQVYKRDKWPDFVTWLKSKEFDNYSFDTLDEKREEWIKETGINENIAFLKEFTSQFRLA